MKKTVTSRSTRIASAPRLDAVFGSTRAQIIEIGAPNPSDQDPDIRAEIIDFG